MKDEIVRGLTASGKGLISGKAKLIKNPDQEVSEEEIMIVEITTPLYFSQIVKAKAIITDFGGLLCHTAILAREFGKPCIVGTENATSMIKDGEIIELDCNSGRVYRNGN